MRRHFKRLIGDRRGNAILIAAGALPLVIGAAGLASDTVQWTMWKRQLQRAADSAAIAGSLARHQGTNLDTSVNAELTRNDHLWMADLAAIDVTTTPADTSTEASRVNVSLSIQQKLGFSSVFMSAAPVINVNARAAMLDEGDFCVVALEKGTDPGIIIQGSTTSNLGCAVISDSIAVTDAVDTIGNAYTFNSPLVAAVGGLPTSISGAAKLQPYHVAMPDPYAGLDTSVPSSTPCTNFNSHKGTTSGGVTQLTPGCFTGFDRDGNYNLQPGVYYLNNTDMDRTGNGSLTGTGVTIVLTGTSPGTIKFNGNSGINLSAPVDVGNPFFKILFAQSLNATNNNDNVINGNNSSSLDGALYFPKGKITFSGSSSALSKCLMVVGKQVHFSGNSNIQNNTTGCVADSTKKGKRVRLVA